MTVRPATSSSGLRHQGRWAHRGRDRFEVPDRVRQFVLAVAEGYKAGLIDTFIGPIKDQDGVVRIAKGEFWGNEKMGDWDWLIEGMIGEAQ